MKKLLTGSSSKRQAQTNSHQQSSVASDPRNTQPNLYRPDQPHFPPNQQPPPDLQNPLNREISQRRPHQLDQPPQGVYPPPGYQPQIISPQEEDYRYQAQPLSNQPPEKEERRRFRDILGLGGNKDQAGDRKGGLGRSVSIRNSKASPNPDRFSGEGGPQWTQQNNSSQLLSPTEDPEDAQHNQFHQRQFPPGPPVPVKDDQLYQQQQTYYPPPGTQHIPALQNFHQGQEPFVAADQEQHLRHQYQQQPLQPGQLAHDQPEQYPGPPTRSSTLDTKQGNAFDQAGAPGQARFSTESSRDPEILQPNPTRGGSVRQAPSDQLFLQAPAHGVQSPPSPLPQPGDNQPPQVQPPSPSGTQRSIPSPMPPPSRSGQGRDAKGLASRDSSMNASSGVRGQGAIPQDLDRGNTPSNADDEEGTQLQALQDKYKELNTKYQKVKRFYFEKESQVHQLQNTLANQRLSASRTSLDDSEYIARFDRLSGLMSSLSFTIRKNWNKVPDFLVRSINKDAIAAGKQEMTAVGRAFMSWWLYLNVFDHIFHPDLDPHLSVALKTVSNNLRRCAPQTHSTEEEEALSAKISSWRMATVEGLADNLRSHLAEQNHQSLVQHLNEKLYNDISEFLTDPPPPDLANGVLMIVELAVKIASHLPMESREVSIEYYPPFFQVNPEYMKFESGIPALTNPVVPIESSGDAQSDKDRDHDHSDYEDDGAQPVPPAKEERRKGGGILGNLMGGSNGGGPANVGKGSLPSQAQQQMGGAKTHTAGKPSNGSGRETPTAQVQAQAGKEERVRLAIGLGVIIRNRSVLVKVPVYTTMV